MIISLFLVGWYSVDTNTKLGYKAIYGFTWAVNQGLMLRVKYA